MKFNSQICTSREQSERLLALGLKKETADCYYWQETEPMYGEAAGIWHLENLDSKDNQEHFEYLDKYFGVCLADDEEHYFIPAWSLDRLMELVPHRHGEYCDYANYFMYYYNIPFDVIEQFRGKTRYGYLIDCIEWLIKEGYFKKEYLV